VGLTHPMPGVYVSNSARLYVEYMAQLAAVLRYKPEGRGFGGDIFCFGLMT